MIYRVTDDFNFLYLTGEGRIRWRDEEYSSTFTSRKEAQAVIEACGYKHDSAVHVVECHNE